LDPKEGSDSTVERRFAAMTARAAERKRSRPEPESDRVLPSELERESSRINSCVAPRVVGAGRGLGIHLTNVTTASLRSARLNNVMSPAQSKPPR